jgi:hypothetical protein
MNEEKISRMSIAEYQAWQESFIKHSVSLTQVAIDTEALYEQLVDGLKLQVVVSPNGSISAHILMLLDEAKKLPDVHHVYHFRWVDLDADESDEMVGTVISEKDLKSEFAWILADLVRKME